MPRITALAGLTLLVIACGGTPSGGSIATAGPSVVATSAPSVAPTPAAPSATASVLPSTAGAYSTRTFGTPIEFSAPAFVPSEPSDESDHFMTWVADDESVAIRFLQPVVVYAPGSSTTSAVPTDYIAYLLGQADHGATFADRADTTVDGHKATVLTATTGRSIDGSLGCPETGMTAEDCFGLQPEFYMRLAVVTTDAGPLLIWLRSAADAPADIAAAKDRFEQVLAGVRFR
jgi:hypothetical protein